MTFTKCLDCDFYRDGVFLSKCPNCDSYHIEAEFRPTGINNEKRHNKSKRKSRKHLISIR